MPSWTADADAIMEKIEERGRLILAMYQIVKAKAWDDADWVDYHLDLAFEGRVDYLRSR